jgi:hypothetical protein
MLILIIDLRQYSYIGRLASVFIKKAPRRVSGTMREEVTGWRKELRYDRFHNL